MCVSGGRKKPRVYMCACERDRMDYICVLNRGMCDDALCVYEKGKRKGVFASERD